MRSPEGSSPTKNFGIELAGSVNSITNFGTIEGAINSIRGGAGIDKITNSGVINGAVSFSGGNDVFTNYVTDASGTRPGTVDSVIATGSGDDRFFGGSNAEVVQNDAGSDVVNFGGGNDTYNAICNPLATVRTSSTAASGLIPIMLPNQPASL